MKTRFKNLCKCGIEKYKAWEWANTRKGYWRISLSPILTRALNNENLRRANYPFLLLDYVGHIFNPAWCKSRHTPSWQEVLATGKGVVCEDKSEGSHQQMRGNDAQKLDTGLHSGWQAGNGLRSKTIRRTEFVTVRSSQFKIETMEQKKEIAYQLEPFDINGQSAVYPSPNRRNVEETDGGRVLQAVSADKQGRALVCGIMEQVCSPDNLRRAYKRVKQNK